MTLAFDTYGTGPSIVLLHGGGIDRSVWHGTAPRIAAAGYRVLCPDMPGHGRQPLPQHDTVEALAAPIADWLATEAPNPHLLLGHSLGGMAAILLAADAEIGPARLILADTTAQTATGRGVAAAIAVTRLLARLLGRRGIAWLSAKGHGIANTPQNEPILKAMRTTPWPPHRMLAAAARFDARDRLPAIGGPTLLLLAERNAATRAAARVMAPALPRSVTETLPGTGHLLMLDAPQAFADAVVAFARDT